MLEVIDDRKVKPICCGEPMRELIAGETDGAAEKHVPFYTKDGHKIEVQIGEVPHPMTEEHYIEFIELVQGGISKRVLLKPGDEPKAKLFLNDENAPFEIYEYCNLHGLWKKDGN